MQDDYKGTLPFWWTQKEDKFHDVSWTSANISNTGAITLDSLLKIAAGTGESQRVGREIVVQCIEMNMHCSMASQGDMTSTDQLRVLVYVDNNANGATATVTDILESTSWLAFYNRANDERFDILLDEFITFNPRAAAGDGTTNASHTTSILQRYKLNTQLKVLYSGTAGLLTEIASTNIGVLAITNNGLANTETVARVTFNG